MDTFLKVAELMGPDQRLTLQRKLTLHFYGMSSLLAYKRKAGDIMCFQ